MTRGPSAHYGAALPYGQAGNEVGARFAVAGRVARRRNCQRPSRKSPEVLEEEPALARLIGRSQHRVAAAVHDFDGHSSGPGPAGDRVISGSDGKALHSDPGLATAYLHVDKVSGPHSELGARLIVKHCDEATGVGVRRRSSKGWYLPVPL